MKHVIALVDCDSFFVSCEQALNPKLVGRPVCVVTGDNGCVVSRSKEAKKMGVKMGAPMFMTKKEFPKAIYLNCRHGCYHDFSSQVMTCLRSLVSDVEVVSIDEAYSDLTSLDAVYHLSYTELAQKIRSEIYQKCKIPVSIGLSSCKVLAKLASDKAKNTGGVFMIATADIEEVLRSTDVNDVCGIGRNHARMLSMNSIYSAWDFANREDAWVRKQMGISGLDLKYELLGNYIKKLVTIPQLPQSVQDTSILPGFTSDIGVIRSQLYEHLHRACKRMRSDGCFCTTAGIMLRTKDFNVITDKIKLPAALDAELEIAKSIIPLLNKIYYPGVLYRSSGVMLGGLVSPQQYQPTLFENMQFKSSPLSAAWDTLENKFGHDILKTGLMWSKHTLKTNGESHN